MGFWFALECMVGDANCVCWRAQFQLIVITHDEDFLEKLSGSGELDK